MKFFRSLMVTAGVPRVGAGAGGAPAGMTENVLQTSGSVPGGQVEFGAPAAGVVGSGLGFVVFPFWPFDPLAPFPAVAEVPGVVS
jgi:hypothetical protein